MHDIAIRNATLVDGTGSAPVTSDIAIADGLIVALGSDVGPARRDIEAAGLIAAPGWVDIHTHYDGQASWDGEMAPSSWHGVTTAVMGNCGVGFAPARPDRHDWLIGLMEGVEDIPGSALTAGISWRWESFPEYMDAIAAIPRAIDIAAQVPHGALRAYVMGERGAANEQANGEDVQRMRDLVLESLQAGAVGFSTSRTMLHLSKDGVPVPGTFANEDEVLGIGSALGAAGHGVFQLASDLTPAEPELAWMARLSASNDAPVVYSLAQFHSAPESWRAMVGATERANAEGARVYAGVGARGIGVLLAWESNLHPFYFLPSFQPLLDLERGERLRALRDPGVRARLLSEEPVFLEQFEGDDNLVSRREIMEGVTYGFHNIFRMTGGRDVDYEPSRDESVEALAKAQGRPPREVAYDLMLENDGRGTLYFPIGNYAYANYDHVLDMLNSGAVVASLSDGGAHVGLMCDASQPTFMLTHWVRDRTRGARIPLERAVQLQTSATAAIYGFTDRGVIAPGKRADINLIDFDRLRVGRPSIHYDLPGGAKRFLQRPDGYAATLVAGTVVREAGEDTGARPGRLIRGRSKHKMN